MFTWWRVRWTLCNIRNGKTLFGFQTLVKFGEKAVRPLIAALKTERDEEVRSLIIRVLEALTKPWFYKMQS